MTPSGPTGFSVPTTRSSKIATTSTSKSAIRKREGSGKDCRPESSSCRIGIMSDEDRYDEERTANRKKSAARRHRTNRKSPKKSKSVAQEARPLAASKEGRRRP